MEIHLLVHVQNVWKCRYYRREATLATTSVTTDDSICSTFFSRSNFSGSSTVSYLDNIPNFNKVIWTYALTMIRIFVQQSKARGEAKLIHASSSYSLTRGGNLAHAESRTFFVSASSRKPINPEKKLRDWAAMLNPAKNLECRLC